MSKYTAEQVEEAATTNEHPIPLRVREMLRAYAALLRERETDKVGVTDEAVDTALTAMFGEQFADVHGKTESALKERMRAALEAAQPAAAVPDGWKLVPIEPTHEMCGAPDHVWHPEAKIIWKQMINATPQLEAKKA